MRNNKSRSSFVCPEERINNHHKDDKYIRKNSKSNHKGSSRGDEILRYRSRSNEVINRRTKSSCSSSSTSSIRRKSSTRDRHYNVEHSYEYKDNDDKLKTAPSQITNSAEVRQTDKKHKAAQYKAVAELISSELIDNLKQSGLFDEIRIRLLDKIECNNKFCTLKDEFRKEIDSFCNRSADFGLPRAKLRDQLNEKNLPSSFQILVELVGEVTSQEKDRLRELYLKEAKTILKRDPNTSCELIKN